MFLCVCVSVCVCVFDSVGVCVFERACDCDCVQQLFDGDGGAGAPRGRGCAASEPSSQPSEVVPQSSCTQCHERPGCRCGGDESVTDSVSSSLVTAFQRRIEREMPNARARDPSAVMNGADIWNAAKRGDHVAISRLAEQVRTETSPTLDLTLTPRQHPISPSPL